MDIGRAIVIAGIIIAIAVVIGHSISRPIPDLQDCGKAFGTARRALRKTPQTDGAVDWFKFPDDCSYWMNTEFLAK